MKTSLHTILLFACALMMSCDNIANEPESDLCPVLTMCNGDVVLVGQGATCDYTIDIFALTPERAFPYTITTISDSLGAWEEHRFGNYPQESFGVTVAWLQESGLMCTALAFNILSADCGLTVMQSAEDTITLTNTTSIPLTVTVQQIAGALRSTTLAFPGWPTLAAGQSVVITLNPDDGAHIMATAINPATGRFICMVYLPLT